MSLARSRSIRSLVTDHCDHCLNTLSASHQWSAEPYDQNQTKQNSTAHAHLKQKKSPQIVNYINRYWWLLARKCLRHKHVHKINACWINPMCNRLLLFSHSHTRAPTLSLSLSISCTLFFIQCILIQMNYAVAVNLCRWCFQRAFSTHVHLCVCVCVNPIWCVCNYILLVAAVLCQ